MSSSIADRLRAGPVLGAEGYVFELERRGYIMAGPFVPEASTSSSRRRTTTSARP